MSPDVFDGLSFDWVSVEYLFEHISGIIADVLGTVVLASQYFFVQRRCVRVFERQVPAYHGEQDDSARPDVHIDAVLGFTCYHLWCSIAWTAACSFEHFSLFVCVAQTEVHNFDIMSIV